MYKSTEEKKGFKIKILIFSFVLCFPAKNKFEKENENFSSSVLSQAFFDI